MADRRRVNGPGSSTLPPVYDDGELNAASRRQRAPDAIRPLCEIKPIPIIYTAMSYHENSETKTSLMTRSQDRGNALSIRLRLSRD